MAGDAADGWAAEKIFGPKAAHGLTFDDIVFLPALQAADVQQGRMAARFSKNISLKMPFVATPGRTVCEERMAVQMALMGGIGVIHCEQDVQEQAAMVRKVKEHQTAFILNPATLGPRATLQSAEQLMDRVGCSCLPITENGRMGGKLMGLLTRRDVDAAEDALPKSTLVTEVMVQDVVTASEPVTYSEAQVVMKQGKVGKLPVINSERELVALICRGDNRRADAYPDATRDPNTQLMVAAAIPVDEQKIGDGLGWDRAAAVVDAGADALMVVVDDGVTEVTLDFVKRLKATYLTTDIVVGHVQSVRCAEALCKADCDGVIVGAPVDNMFAAPSTSATGGHADATALYQIAKLVRVSFGAPVCLDGGVRSPADVVKAFCLGATCVAPREMLARTIDSPGEFVYQGGARVKLRPPRGARDAPELPTEGAQVVDGGSVADLLPFLVDRARAGFSALGLKGLGDVHPALSSGALRFEVHRPHAPAPAAGLPERRRVASSGLFDRW